MTYGMGKAYYTTSQLKKKTSRNPHRACCGAQPFQFEPTYPPGEEPDDSEEASGESDSELEESKNREHRLLHL